MQVSVDCMCVDRVKELHSDASRVDGRVPELFRYNEMHSLNKFSTVLFFAEQSSLLYGAEENTFSMHSCAVAFGETTAHLCRKNFDCGKCENMHGDASVGLLKCSGYIHVR